MTSPAFHEPSPQGSTNATQEVPAGVDIKRVDEVRRRIEAGHYDEDTAVDKTVDAVLRKLKKQC
ncbi:MAG: hypothetical protein AAF800_13070 [Planctomycetota bacterium]